MTALEVGGRDSYGDYPTAWALGGVVGMVIVAIGLIGWGLWLRTEEAVDLDIANDPPAITA